MFRSLKHLDNLESSLLLDVPRKNSQTIGVSNLRWTFLFAQAHERDCAGCGFSWPVLSKKRASESHASLLCMVMEQLLRWKQLQPDSWGPNIYDSSMAGHVHCWGQTGMLVALPCTI